MTWLLLVLSVIAGTAGDLLTAKGMSDHGEIHDFRLNAVLRIAGRLSRNVYMVTGVLAQAISFFSFVALLGVADLSFAVPATALGNVAKTVFARLFLKEQVDWRRWAGALLVSFGVLLVSM